RCRRPSGSPVRGRGGGPCRDRSSVDYLRPPVPDALHGFHVPDAAATLLRPRTPEGSNLRRLVLASSLVSLAVVTALTAAATTAGAAGPGVTPQAAQTARARAERALNPHHA